MDKADESIQQRILKAVGRKVKFRYPGNEANKTGVLCDRVVVASNPNTGGVPYWDVVDLIEFPEEVESQWIRIGYYRKPGEHLVWGSQTTITEPVAVLAIQSVKQPNTGSSPV